MTFGTRIRTGMARNRRRRAGLVSGSNGEDDKYGMPAIYRLARRLPSRTMLAGKRQSAAAKNAVNRRCRQTIAARTRGRGILLLEAERQATAAQQPPSSTLC